MKIIHTSRSKTDERLKKRLINGRRNDIEETPDHRSVYGTK